VAKKISASTEAKVVLSADGVLLTLFQDYLKYLRELFIVSQVEVRNENIPAEMSREADIFTTQMEGLFRVTIQKADGKKCDRCWNYSVHVGENSRYPTVCERWQRGNQGNRSRRSGCGCRWLTAVASFPLP